MRGPAVELRALCRVIARIDDPKPEIIGLKRPSGPMISVVLREFFTVDLRGLRTELAARAAIDGLTESEVLRSALATALGPDRSASTMSPISSEGTHASVDRVKLSIRISHPSACRLDRNARAAGLSRGAYLTRLIDGAPMIIASSDRAAMVRALAASTTELADLSRDINQLVQLLRRGLGERARAYIARHDALDGLVRQHLAVAAPVLAELSSIVGRRPTRSR